MHNIITESEFRYACTAMFRFASLRFSAMFRSAPAIFRSGMHFSEVSLCSSAIFRFALQRSFALLFSDLSLCTSARSRFTARLAMFALHMSAMFAFCFALCSMQRCSLTLHAPCSEFRLGVAQRWPLRSHFGSSPVSCLKPWQPWSISALAWIMRNQFWPTASANQGTLRCR